MTTRFFFLFLFFFFIYSKKLPLTKPPLGRETRDTPFHVLNATSRDFSDNW